MADKKNTHQKRITSEQLKIVAKHEHHYTTKNHSEVMLHLMVSIKQELREEIYKIREKYSRATEGDET